MNEVEQILNEYRHESEITAIIANIIILAADALLYI